MIALGAVVLRAVTAASLIAGGQGMQAVPAGPAPGGPVADGGRLFGRVLTTDGTVHEGYIRWDRNEGSWVDLLHGSKIIPERNYEEAVELGGDEYATRERGFTLFGFTVNWDEEEAQPDQSLSAVRFGHLRSVEVLDDERALLVFKSGAEVEMVGSSTDLGENLRGIVVEDGAGAEVTLDWDEVEVVDFTSATGAAAPRTGERLHGTVTTWWGEAFVGFIGWDSDEIFTSDLLDGEDRGEDRSIPFDSIALIEHSGDDGAIVTFHSGESIRLAGSNDVDHTNRGIVVSDPGLGQLIISWDDFESLALHAAPTEDLYTTFDGGQSLYGTVTDDRGASLTGYIRWDNDEEFTWEILDGVYREIEVDVEFGQIRSIQRLSDSTSAVTLWDGRFFELEESNDVSEGNKGVFVTTDDGELHLVHWRDFGRADFQRR